MRTRSIIPEDIDLTNAWRRVRGVNALPREALPDVGLMALRDDGTPLAGAWLYLTNAQFAYLAWPVTNPQASLRESNEALERITRELLDLARSLGLRYVVSTSASRGLTKLLVRCGMTVEPRDHDMLTMEVELCP
jgi:hypothetical protein